MSKCSMTGEKQRIVECKSFFLGLWLAVKYGK